MEPRQFISLWAHPRTAAWALLTAVAVACAQLPFVGFEVIPFVVRFDPGFALVPAAGIFLGPAGVVGAVGGALLADALGGGWTGLTTYRAAAFLFAAWTAHACWPRPGADLQAGLPRWKGILRIAAAGVPAAAAAAAWSGLGADVGRLYPFGYVAGVVLTHHLFFVLLFAPAVDEVARRYWFPEFGTWDTVLPPQGAPRSGLVAVGAAAAAIGAWGIGVLLGGWIAGDWPGDAVLLGQWSGAPARIGAGVLLGLQALMLAWPPGPRRRATREGAPPPKYRHLRIEPL